MDAQTRQEYIRAAVTFLQNPKLVDSPLKDKIDFLKNKGLSDIEVDEALNLALVNRHHHQNGKWNFLLILGVCIGGYRLYKAYQESRQNYIAQQEKVELEQKQQKQQEEERENEKSKKEKSKEGNKVELQITLNQLLSKIADIKRGNEYFQQDFRKEILSIKTLLLSHDKFAAPPSIPAWQLEDKERQDEDSKLQDDNKNSEDKDSELEDEVISPTSSISNDTIRSSSSSLSQENK